MTRDRITRQQVTIALTAGFFLLGIALLTPNLGGSGGRNFIFGAMSTTWSAFFDWPAVWCSLKWIMCSVAVFLILDALGTVMIKLGFRSLASLFFCSNLFTCIAILPGFFYLVKGLL